ncbi:MAG TPA: HEAT repeat domain-containing protein [Planctomycetota bacterium]|nr:HEAT repeat domain-containing protein [Planctomycetota bacterium]
MKSNLILVMIGAAAAALCFGAWMSLKGAPPQSVAEKPNTQAAIPQVVSVLTSPDPAVRSAAIKTLGSHIASDPALAAAIDEALVERDNAVVRAAQRTRQPLPMMQHDFLAERRVDAERRADGAVKKEVPELLRKRHHKLMLEADEALARNDVEGAIVSLDLAKSLGLGEFDPRARETERELETRIAQRRREGGEAGRGMPGRAPAQPRAPGEFKPAEGEMGRREQVMLFIREAEELAEKKNFDAALLTLDRARTAFPDDRRLADVRQRVEMARANPDRQRLAGREELRRRRENNVGELNPFDNNEKDPQVKKEDPNLPPRNKKAGEINPFE